MIDFTRAHPIEFLVLWALVGFAVGAAVGTCIRWAQS